MKGMWGWTWDVSTGRSVSHYRTTEEKGGKEGRGSGGAQQGPAFPMQLDNVTPIVKKVELSSGKNKYNTTNHWQVRRRVKIDPKHSVRDGTAKTTATRPLRNKNTKHGRKHSRPVNQHWPLHSHKHRNGRGRARFAFRVSFYWALLSEARPIKRTENAALTGRTRQQGGQDVTDFWIREKVPTDPGRIRQRFSCKRGDQTSDRAWDCCLNICPTDESQG